MSNNVLDREAFDKALSEVGMHLSGRYEQMLLAHDAALRERVEELEERVRDAYCDGYRQGVEDQREGFVSADSTVETLAENWCIDRARQALDTGGTDV